MIEKSGCSADSVITATVEPGDTGLCLWRVELGRYPGCVTLLAQLGDLGVGDVEFRLQRKACGFVVVLRRGVGVAGDGRPETGAGAAGSDGGSGVTATAAGSKQGGRHGRRSGCSALGRVWLQLNSSRPCRGNRVARWRFLDVV